MEPAIQRAGVNMPYNALQVLPGCFPLLILSRRQENMPYNAIQGLPGCFPLLILSQRAGDYALGGPPDGSFLPSEFHDRELPSNTIIIPRVSCGYPNPNKLKCKQPSPYGRDCRLHTAAGTAGISLRDAFSGKEARGAGLLQPMARLRGGGIYS